MRHPRVYEALGTMASTVAAGNGSGDWLARLPAWLQRGPLAAWASQRDLPRLPERSFRQLWRARRRTEVG